ncbi:MAG TPA: MFS transporter [Stellaceae bacterium]|nr:MFS transporter [Stellaceae bacterium]
MASPQVLDITRFIDDRRMNRFNAMVVIFSFFIILFDGYDIAAVGFAGPSLVKAWGIQSMAALGAAFSAGLFGILFGSPLLGWVGDRYGRIVAIVGSCMVIGIFTLATAAAGSLTTLIWLRFFTGVGIGGMLPNIIALNAEFAPKRARATMIIVMFTGITFGGAVPGPVAALFVPTYGWQILFLIGGVAPLVIGLAAWAWLPESLKHLVVKEGGRERAVRIIKAMDPTLAITPQTRLVVADEKVYAAFRPTQLFQEGLRWITPLLWLCFICNLMSFYFLNTWLPTVLAAAHMPTSFAVLSTSIFQIGGTLGGLSLSRPIDKSGLMPVCVLFVISLVVAPFLGYAREPEWLLICVIFLSGFTLLGLQFGLNATSAMIYPTSIRSNGSGWAFAVGRVGSVTGPIAAGVLIGMQLTIEHLYLALLVPLSIGTIASFVLARLYYVRFQGMGLGRRDTLDAAARGAD